MTFTIIQPTVLGSTTKISTVILAGNNSVRITHSLGRVVQVFGIYGTDDNAQAFKVINETNNYFDVAFPNGITQAQDTGVQGYYV